MQWLVCARGLVTWFLTGGEHAHAHAHAHAHTHTHTSAKTVGEAVATIKSMALA